MKHTEVCMLQLVQYQVKVLTDTTAFGENKN